VGDILDLQSKEVNDNLLLKGTNMAVAHIIASQEFVKTNEGSCCHANYKSELYEKN
jgi:hypothetical protein